VVWLLRLALAGRPDAATRFSLILPLMLAFGFFSNLLYAAMGSLLRDWLSGPGGSGRRLRWFNRAMAGVLVLTAGWMATL
jgi:threonine/homoserine/homoserine lactone efflux protein